MDGNQRELARELVRQPAFARNFGEMGLREVREIPEVHDVSAV